MTPGQIIGPGAALFRSAVPLNSRPHLGQHAGDIDDWSDSIGKVAKLSNYIAFAIMAALAGPLLRFVELPEDPAFNFVGPSSGGKTRAAMAGASALGHPAAISSWDLTERAVEEAAAARTDCFLVLNAAEKASPKRRREVLNRIVHMVAERQSTIRSESVQDRLPNLAWRTLLLTTSNKTGAEMANDLGFPWREQEAVRFIDIPVPGPDDGGIFDRLENATDKAAKSTKLIRELEKDLMKYYGVLLRPWIEHLLATQPRRRVAKLIRRFEEKTGPHTGVEDRIARKFGLVYAAGRIAVEAGLLKWSTGLPLRATTALYRRAKQLRLNGDGQVSEALTKLAEALADPAVVPPAAPRARVKVSDEKAFLGVRYRLNGKQVVGLRKEKLAQLVGDAMVGPVLKKLNERGAIITGHGGKSTQQLLGRLCRSAGKFYRNPASL